MLSVHREPSLSNLARAARQSSLMDTYAYQPHQAGEKLLSTKYTLVYQYVMVHASMTANFTR